MSDFILSSKTDKLQMKNKIIDRINKQINSFFTTVQSTENILNIKGTWGTGKTTVVKNLEENFNNKDVNFYIINLWEYETTLNPYISLVKDILYKIIDKDSLNLEKPELSKNQRVTKWFLNLSWQIPLIGIKVKGGVETETTKEKIKDLEELTKEAISEITNIIKQDDKKIVIIFDELDRCIPNNQIIFLSYIKNIFFKIKNIFFIVACNNEYIDSKLSLDNNYLESYTCKLFNKTIDLNLIIPSYRGFFTNNEFINKFINKISSNKKNTLSAREINDWLEKVNLILFNLKKENFNNKDLKMNGKEICIYDEIKDEIEFIIFFCFYIKNKEKEYYYEVVSNEIDNFIELNNFNLLFNFFSETTRNFNPLYKLNDKEHLNQLININNWDETHANIFIFLGWKDAPRNDYSFHVFALLPFILPIISKENSYYLFEKNITKKHYMTQIRSLNNPFNNQQYLNILFNCETDRLPIYLKLFLDIIWENAKNKLNISNFYSNIVSLIMKNFNYKDIFNIIENTIFY